MQILIYRNSEIIYKSERQQSISIQQSTNVNYYGKYPITSYEYA